MDQIPVELIAMIMEYLTISGVLSFTSTAKAYRKILSIVTTVNGQAVLYEQSLMPNLRGSNVYLRRVSLPVISATKSLRLYISRKVSRDSLYSLVSRCKSTRITLVSDREDLPFNSIAILDVKDGQIASLCSNDLDMGRMVGAYGLFVGTMSTTSVVCGSYYICSGVFMKSRYVPTLSFKLDPVRYISKGSSNYSFMSRLVRLKCPLNELTTTGVYEGWTTPLNIVYVILYSLGTEALSTYPHEDLSINRKLLQMIAMAMHTAKPNNKAHVTSNALFKRVIPSIIQPIDHNVGGEIEALDPSKVQRVVDDGNKIITALREMNVLRPYDHVSTGFSRYAPVNVSAMITVLLALGVTKGGSNPEIIKRTWDHVRPVIVDDRLVPSSWAIDSMVGPEFPLANRTICEFIRRFGIVDVSHVDTTDH